MQSGGDGWDSNYKRNVLPQATTCQRLLENWTHLRSFGEIDPRDPQREPWAKTRRLWRYVQQHNQTDRTQRESRFLCWVIIWPQLLLVAIKIYILQQNSTKQKLNILFHANILPCRQLDDLPLLWSRGYHAHRRHRDWWRNYHWSLFHIFAIPQQHQYTDHSVDYDYKHYKTWFHDPSQGGRGVQ